MERREDMDKGTRYPYYMYQPSYVMGQQLQTQYRPNTLFGQPGLFLSYGPNLNAPLMPSDTVGMHLPSTFQSESPSVQQHSDSQGGMPQEATAKKRGRPRKYGTDRLAALGVSSGSSAPHLSSEGSESESKPALVISEPKKGRGRPRGSGSRQKLASIGGLMLSSAGTGFKPYVVKVSTGEDIAEKLTAFSQKGSRNICILSANGAVSRVSMLEPPFKRVTYQGHFEILSLSGTYVYSVDADARDGLNGLRICLSDSECHVFGGSIFGPLPAASPVQMILASFSHGGTKAVGKPEVGLQAAAEPSTEHTDEVDGNQQTDSSSPPIQDSALFTMRPGPGQIGTRSIPRDIDLTRAANM